MSTPSAAVVRAGSWVLVGVVAVVLVGVVALLVTRAWADPTVPPLASGPGVVRAHSQVSDVGANLPPTEVSYAGTTFKVAVGTTWGSGDSKRVGLSLVGPGGTTQKYAEYRRGDSITIDGASRVIRTIYVSRDESKDFVDLQVVPPGR